MSTYRSSQIFITRGTRRMLSVIARAEGEDNSADAVGERLLADAITTRYPALAALQKKIEDVESEMVNAVREAT